MAGVAAAGHSVGGFSSHHPIKLEVTRFHARGRRIFSAGRSYLPWENVMPRDPVDEPLRASAEDGYVVITHAGRVITLSADAADESLGTLTLAICKAVGQRQRFGGSDHGT